MIVRTSAAVLALAGTACFSSASFAQSCAAKGWQNDAGYVPRFAPTNYTTATDRLSNGQPAPSSSGYFYIDCEWRMLVRAQAAPQLNLAVRPGDFKGTPTNFKVGQYGTVVDQYGSVQQGWTIRADGYVVDRNGNLIAQGGGNLIAQGGGNLIAQGGGNLIAQGGGNIVSTGGGNIVSTGGGNILTPAGSNILTPAGSNVGGGMFKPSVIAPTTHGPVYPAQSSGTINAQQLAALRPQNINGEFFTQQNGAWYKVVPLGNNQFRLVPSAPSAPRVAAPAPYATPAPRYVPPPAAAPVAVARPGYNSNAPGFVAPNPYAPHPAGPPAASGQRYRDITTAQLNALPRRAGDTEAYDQGAWRKILQVGNGRYRMYY